MTLRRSSESCRLERKKLIKKPLLSDRFTKRDVLIGPHFKKNFSNNQNPWLITTCDWVGQKYKAARSQRTVRCLCFHCHRSFFCCEDSELCSVSWKKRQKAPFSSYLEWPPALDRCFFVCESVKHGHENKRWLTPTNSVWFLLSSLHRASSVKGCT